MKKKVIAMWNWPQEVGCPVCIAVDMDGNKVMEIVGGEYINRDLDFDESISSWEVFVYGKAIKMPIDLIFMIKKVLKTQHQSNHDDTFLIILQYFFKVLYFERIG